MPNFVEFARESKRESRDHPMFTLQARGLLSFNQAAFMALGEPVAVALLYDPDEHLVALRKVSKTYKNAYQVRQQQQAKSYLVGAQAFVSHNAIPTPRARRFAGKDYGDGVWGFALSEGVDVKNLRGTPQPGEALTDRWRHTTDGFEVPALMRIDHKTFSSPGSWRAGADSPPSMRIGTLVASDPLGPALTTSELRGRFLAFLAQQPILDLVSAMSHIDRDATWKSMAGNGRLLMEAAMMIEGQDEAPVAAAMILLPEVGRSGYGGDPRCAELVLHIEPRTADRTPMAPIALPKWHEKFTQALAIPEALARFLTHDLGLNTPADPPAQLGVWLKAPHALTEMVDVGDLKPLPGSAQANWFVAYAIASPEGEAAAGTASDFIGQMCDFSLHLNNWEGAMEGIGGR